jgi:hypothetical protein
MQRDMLDRKHIIEKAMGPNSGKIQTRTEDLIGHSDIPHDIWPSIKKFVVESTILD